MEAEIRRAFDDLRAARVGTIGQVVLTDSVTSTTVTTRTVSQSSIVLLMPMDDGAAAEGIPKTVPAKGSFTLTHTSSATTRTYRYVVLNNING